MSNALSHALPYPIRKARFSLQISFRVAAGTPTDPTTPDTEFSIDGGATFTDCAEEITTGGANGVGYITLSGAETDNALVALAAKSANCVTTPVILHPRNLAVIGSGTLSAGSSGGGTLGTLLAYDVTNCFIRTTGGTGGGGTGGANNQARRILTYNTGTGAFTVATWETTPDATTTYDVLLPEGVTLGMLKALNPTTAGRTITVSTGGVADSNLAQILGTAITETAGLIAAAFSKFFNKATPTGTVNSLPDAVAGASLGLAIVGSNMGTITGGTITTYTGNTPQTGDAYARLGAPAGASVSADIAEIEVETDDIAAIKTQTDKLAFTVTNQVDANVLDWKSATAPAMTGDAFARLGAPAGASVSADILEANADLDELITTVGVAGAGLTGIPGTGDTTGTTTLLTRIPGTVQPQTGDSYARLGAPAGASIAADLAEIEAETDAIGAAGAGLTAIPTVAHVTLVDTVTTLTGNTAQTGDSYARIGANGASLTALATASALAALALYASRTVGRGTVGTATTPSTTQFTPSAFSPSGASANQFVGRIIVFDNDTTTAALRGAATDITASSNAALPLLTFTALPTAPASTDSFSVV